MPKSAMAHSVLALAYLCLWFADRKDETKGLALSGYRRFLALANHPFQPRATHLIKVIQQATLRLREKYAC